MEWHDVLNLIYQYPLVTVIALLVVFTLVTIGTRRLIVYNGKQEGVKRNFHIFTIDNGHGTSFASKHRILRPNELASRRRKFGQPIWSWPITVIGALLVLYALGLFRP